METIYGTGFVFFGLMLIFINFKGFGIWRSLYLTIGILWIGNLLLRAELISAIIIFITFASAYAVYNHGTQNDVRLKLLFAIITFFLPPIGIILYLLLWKKMSRKIGETIKTDQGSITFHNV